MAAALPKANRPPVSCGERTTTSAARCRQTSYTSAGVNTDWSAAIGTLTASLTWRRAAMLWKGVGCSTNSGRRRQPADHVDGLGDAPGAVRVEPQAAAADRFAYGCRVPQVGGFTAPDLQVDDAVPRLGKVARIFGEFFRGVALDEAEVVDLLAHRAAEEPVHRPAGSLAEDVPERHLEAGQNEVACHGVCSKPPRYRAPVISCSMSKTGWPTNSGVTPSSAATVPSAGNAETESPTPTRPSSVSTSTRTTAAAWSTRPAQ